MTRDRAVVSQQRRVARLAGWIRNSKLSIVCFALFFVLLGRAERHGLAASTTPTSGSTASRPISLRRATSPPATSVEATFENWESEFLQMARLRGAHRVPRPEGLGRVEAAETATTSTKTRAAPRRSRRAVAGPARRDLAQALRELAAHRVRRPVPRLDRSVTRSAAHAEYNAEQQRARRRRRSARSQFVRTQPVLVRVVPELAERVPRGRRDRRADDLPAPTRIAGIEAGPRSGRRDRRLTCSFEITTPLYSPSGFGR